MRPYGGFEDELVLVGAVEGSGDGLVRTVPGADGEAARLDEAVGLGDTDADGVLYDCEYAGTSDCEPVLARAWMLAGTDWLFCSAALT